MVISIYINSLLHHVVEFITWKRKDATLPAQWRSHSFEVARAQSRLLTALIGCLNVLLIFKTVESACLRLHSVNGTEHSKLMFVI